MTTELEDTAELLGSASWIGADAYEPGEEFHERATKFLAAVKWDVLASISSRLRNGIPSCLGEKYSIGHSNMVRRIMFADGISWAVRLRLPQLEGNRDLLDVTSILKVEIASMKFLKAKTSIPIPEVYSYSVDRDNDVGAPYILMDYIHGTIATKLRQAKDCDFPLFGTPDQDRKFRQQMATIQATLSSFKFDQIGCLYQDEQSSDFFIGPEIETGKGPWTSSIDYYADIADQSLQVCGTFAPPEVLSRMSFAIPILFKHLMSLYGDKLSIRGPFRLMNRDFGAHNLLVNNAFDIVGVIDLDGVMAAPIEAVAQYPVFSALRREPPGHVETRPAAIDRIKITEPKLKEYGDMVAIAEARLTKGETPVGNMMLSDSASVFQGLREYGGHQDFVNDEWMEAYMRLLRTHIRLEEQRRP